ncbi:MAG: PD-(D/E)XK nuclease family protein [Patescibacteria group bacterium]
MIQKKRTNLYNPDSQIPFNVSRSKIGLFLECPHCFYLDRKLGISRPDMPGWSLNSAVDALLKNEFDEFRDQKRPHTLMDVYRVDAIPFWHQNFHIWRDDVNKKVGASVLHKKTNLNICGIIDDIWQNNTTKELHIVDYKSTSTNGEISLDGEYKEGYKRQMEVYQWIFRQLGFSISNTGYFVYANGIKSHGKTFNDKLEFKTSIIPYIGNSSWVEPTILEIKNCLDSDKVPLPKDECKYCAYRNLIQKESLKNQISLI